MSFAHVGLALRLLWGTGWRRQRLLFLLQLSVVSLAVAGAILTLVLSHSFERAISEKLYSYLGAFWVRSYAQEVESAPRPVGFSWGASERSVQERLVGAVHLPVLMESSRSPYEGVQLLCVEKGWFAGSWQTALRSPLPTWEGNIVVLSDKLARRLQVKPGEEVTIAWLSDPPRFRKLKVVALYHSGLDEIDARLAFTPLPLGQTLRRYEPHQVQVVHVFLTTPEASGKVLDTLQENLTIYEEIVPIEYLFGDIFDWLRLIRQNVSLILGIVVGMSFFVGVAAFLVLMLSARVRFQVLRFLGMSGRALWGLVIAQAVGVVGLGALIGSLLAGGMLLLQAQWGWLQVRPGELFTGAGTCLLGRIAFCLCGLRCLGIGGFDGHMGSPQRLRS
jgi:lipoprotein-releasing system permease protein